MERIILALQNKENRRLLQEWLSPKYEVKIAESDEDLVNSFDLCIFDGLSLDSCWQKVQDKKRAILPTFQHFLLVTARKDVKLVTRQLWQTVDEIILTPIQKIELQARVEMLLRARKYSLEALEKYYSLKEAMAQIKTLRGIIPICANCKKIRDDAGYWNQVEEYIHDHSEAEFSHGFCPECMKKLYGDFIKD